MYIDNIRKILDYQSSRVKQVDALSAKGPQVLEKIELDGVSFGYGDSESNVHC